MLGALFPAESPPGGFFFSPFADPELSATVQSHYTAAIQNHLSASPQSHLVGSLNDRHYTATITK